MLELKARVRKITGRKTKELRKESIIPAVVYGHNLESFSIQISLSDFKKVFEQAGESSLINLKIENQNDKKVLIHAIQYHPLTDNVEHVDFYQIKEGEKITVEVELEFTGISRVVKDLNGILVHELDKIEVECLPKDLIRSIEVDLSKLTKFNDVIRVGDLDVSENIQILSDLENLIVTVKDPNLKREEEKEEVSALAGVEKEEDQKEKEGLSNSTKE